MIHLTRIYTKTGDSGLTALANNYRVPKNSERIEAIGTVDEANAHIGVIVAQLSTHSRAAFYLIEVQHVLFDIGAVLAAPGTDIKEGSEYALERIMDKWLENQEPLTSFILPGGTKLGADVHVARTVVRRAERRVWDLIEESGPVNCAKYLNRLSDFLFVLSRNEEINDKELLWNPNRFKLSD